MPRPTRDSDSEVEAKPGRRYRSLAGATDSPLRRSTRTKQPVGQNESSPDSSLSDNNGGSNIQTRVTRRRTAVMELTNENQRSLRSRKNSVSSDVSEINEVVNTPSKKTRRSIAATASADTPKARTRAGSETKSPPIASRTMRRTRASSMGPEDTTHQNIQDNTRAIGAGLPIMQKRRVSVLPSKPTVIEEKEEMSKVLVVELDRTLSPLIDSKETGKKSTLADVITSSVSLYTDKVDASPKNTMDGKMDGHGQKVENLSAELLKNQDESISNKENQATNVINDTTSEHVDSAVTNTSLQSPKSSPANILIADKTVEDKNKSYITETPLTKPSTDLSKIIISNVTTVKDNVGNIIDAEVNVSQDASCSVNITNTEPSICSTSIAESDISLKLETSNTNSSIENPAQFDNAKDENKSIIKNNDVDCDINKLNVEKKEPENSALEGTEIPNKSPTKVTEELDDSERTEVNIVSQEESSVTKKKETNDELVTKQKSSGEEDSQKMEISEETKESDDLQRHDSSDTIPCSNLSGLTMFETSDPSPPDTSETMTNEISCSEKVKALSNVSSRISDDSQKPNDNVPLSAVESSAKSTESEQSKAEIIQKSITQEIQEEIRAEQEGKSNNSDKGAQKNKEASSEPNVENLFQDISADEWQKERQKDTDPEVNSVRSTSIERLDNESEAECDLVLVDRDAWLAAENIKAAKENEVFDYDSDDTVVLKSRLDSSKAQEQKGNLSIVKEESDIDISETEMPKKEDNGRSLQDIQTVPGEVDDTNEEMEKMDVEEINANKSTSSEAALSNAQQLDADTEMNSSVLKFKEKKRLSKSEKPGKDKEKSDSQSNKSPLESSVTKRNKPQRKSFEGASNIEFRTNSEENDSECEEKFEKIEAKSTKTKIGLDQSATTNDNTKKAMPVTPGKENTEKKMLSNPSTKKKVTSIKLNADSSESETAFEVSSSKCNKISMKSMREHSKKNCSRNSSLYVHIGSGSDVTNDNPDSESDESQIGGRKIPKFLFDDSSSNDSENDGKDSINSDIRREYNLDGENSPKFSDDDMPGDECRASESEYSDPDDNGSDLADFVVDDDEFEDNGDEDDGSGDEGVEDVEIENGAIIEEPENDEIDDDKNSEEEEDESDLNMQIEDTEEQKIEEVGEQIKSAKTNKKDEKTDEHYSVDANKIKAATTEREDEVMDDVEEQKRVQEDEAKESNDEMTGFEKRKNKKEKQRSIENDANDSKESNSGMLRKRSGKKKQLQKQQLNENEAEEAAEERLNAESPMMYSKQKTKLSRLSDCSTPKISKCEALETIMYSPNLTVVRPPIKVHSSSSKKLKVADRSLTLSNISNKLNKSKDSEESLLRKSLPTDLTELVERTNLSRPMSSNVMQLNKSMVIPNTDTPRTKILKKLTLSDSLPALKFEGSSKKRNLAKRKHNASLLASSETTEECEKVAGEPNESILPIPKVDVLNTDENVEKTTLKKQKKSKRLKEANIENVEINVEECDTIPVVTAKKRKYIEENSTLKIDDIEETGVISKKKKQKKEKRKQLCATQSELPDEAQCGNIYKEESQENATTLQKKKKKGKRILKNEETSEICVVENEVTKKKKVKNTNDILQTHIEKPLKKKQNLQNARRSNIGFTKISKKIQAVAERKSNEDKPLIATTSPKMRNQVLKGVKDMVDSKKVSKGTRKNRAKEQPEEVKDPLGKKRQKLECEKITKTNKIKTVQKDSTDSLYEPSVKQQKQLRKKICTLPSRFGFTEGKTILVEEDYSSPSLCQSVTNFDVVDLRSVMKPKKKATVVSTFKQKMLARNSRQPISAYLMYLKKQKAYGKDGSSDTFF